MDRSAVGRAPDAPSFHTPCATADRINTSASSFLSILVMSSPRSAPQRVWLLCACLLATLVLVALPASWVGVDGASAPPQIQGSINTIVLAFFQRALLAYQARYNGTTGIAWPQKCAIAATPHTQDALPHASLSSSCWWCVL